MEEDQCLWTTAGVYEQEERTLLNILSSVGSLRTERLHFRSVPPGAGEFYSAHGVHSSGSCPVLPRSS